MPPDATLHDKPPTPMKRAEEIARRLRAMLERRGNSREDAQDYVQEAFVRLEVAKQDQEIREPEAFVVRAALNYAIDQSRRAKRAPFSPTPLEEYEIVDPTPGPSEVLDGRIRLRRLKAGLDQLNERSRGILLAQREEGLTYREIGIRYGISESAVEKQIARAMKFLANWMEGW